MYIVGSCMRWFDGMLARHLDSESDLGFQLDSFQIFKFWHCSWFINVYGNF